MLSVENAAPVAMLGRIMHTAGWAIEYIDMDLTQAHPKATIKVCRNDGRWLFATVDAAGRASIERFQRKRFLGMSESTKGRRPLSPQVDDIFLGRSPCAGARAMLRELTRYLSDNSLAPIPLAEMRAGWASIMAAPLLLASPSTAGQHAN
ncbi:hypothetical protein CR152_27725 [Massilia violaceinigra]|uniref:Uncharacterized protein n=1 Tax=Massilia violaceinigra TaxID=2045208 RepID=A0A2D2DSC6_9BURK|nr:hypothetical protein CR152_27725 [Massilia violaceinigra]